MANFPMIPMTYQLDNVTLIIHNGTRFSIDSEGNMKVDGSVKDAAVGLIKYVVEAEFGGDVISWELNKAIRIEREDGQYYLECITAKRPTFWDELEKEFHRAVKMKAFW
jgi:hypothetical protein